MPTCALVTVLCKNKEWRYKIFNKIFFKDVFVNFLFLFSLVLQAGQDDKLFLLVSFSNPSIFDLCFFTHLDICSSKTPV